MNDKLFLLQSVLIDKHKVKQLTLAEWDLLIRQARTAGVLVRLAYELEDQGLLEQIDSQPLAHFKSAQVYARQFRLSLNWEVLCIQKALDQKNIPVVLLKGAAYAENNLKVARGRLFSDVDILVEKGSLAEVEVLLITQGWMPSIVDEYDQKYYRQWMHEIPPLTHTLRNTSIDVHHNILPITTKNCPDAVDLFSNIIKIEGKDLWVLAYEDQVLHSATHLFHEGDFRHGFRDLSDLNLLLLEFSELPGFWDALLSRAVEIHQQIPLFLTVRYVKHFFNAAIPEYVMQQAERQAGIGKIALIRMDFLFNRALRPDHASCDVLGTGLARWLLYIRSQFLRMPLSLLIPHLLRKSYMRITGKTQH